MQTLLTDFKYINTIFLVMLIIYDLFSQIEMSNK